MTDDDRLSRPLLLHDGDDNDNGTVMMTVAQLATLISSPPSLLPLPPPLFTMTQ